MLRASRIGCRRLIRCKPRPPRPGGPAPGGDFAALARAFRRAERALNAAEAGLEGDDGGPGDEARRAALHARYAAAFAAAMAAPVTDTGQVLAKLELLYGEAEWREWAARAAEVGAEDMEALAMTALRRDLLALAPRGASPGAPARARYMA